jgi:hypothetical protein
VTIRDLVGEGVCEVVTQGVIVCFNFAEVSTDACVAAGFKGVCDGVELVAVDVVSVSGRAV